MMYTLTAIAGTLLAVIGHPNRYYLGIGIALVTIALVRQWEKKQEDKRS